MNSVYVDTKLRSNRAKEHTNMDHTECAKAVIFI